MAKLAPMISRTRPIHYSIMASHITDFSTLFQRSIPYLKQEVFHFSIPAQHLDKAQISGEIFLLYYSQNKAIQLFQ